MSNADAGNFECERSTMSTWSCVEGVNGYGQPCHFPVHCNEFLVFPPEKSKWRTGYLSWCLLCFITFALSRLHLDVLLPSFFFLCHGKAMQFIISHTRSSVWLSLTLFNCPPTQGHFFVFLALFTSRCCSLLNFCTPRVIVICDCFAYNKCLVSSFVIRLLGSKWWIVESTVNSTLNLKQYNNY